MSALLNTAKMIAKEKINPDLSIRTKNRFSGDGICERSTFATIN